MKYTRQLILISLVLLAVTLSACTTPVSEVQQEEYVGETVTVKGIAQEGVKLGDLSGYMLQGESEDIFISTNTFPQEGDTVRVKGEVKKVPLLGSYYIDEQ